MDVSGGFRVRRAGDFVAMPGCRHRHAVNADDGTGIGSSGDRAGA